MFRGLLPDSQIVKENPVYQQERRSLRWLRTPQGFRDYNLTVLIGLPLLIALWWMLDHLNSGYTPLGFEYRSINVLLVTSLGLMLLSSLYAIPQVIGRLHNQFTSGYWDTLKLTTQSEDDILMAEDAVGQLRLWPLIAVEVGLRIGIVILFFANYLYSFYQNFDPFFSQSVIGCFGWGLILLIGIAYIIEPIVRARLIVAFSIVIAMRVKTLPLTLLTGFGLVLCVHLMQAVFVSVIWFGLPDIAGEDYYATIVYPAVLAGSILYYALYVSLRNAALAYKLRNAFTPD